MRDYDIINAYCSGQSSPEVARQFGLSKRTILRILKRYDIPTRSLSTSVRKHAVNEQYFDKIDTEDKAYWLGFLLADGNIGHTGRGGGARQLRVSLKRSDEKHLSKFLLAIQSAHQIKPVHRLEASHPASIIRITSKHMCSTLESMGWDNFKKHGCTKILDLVPSCLQRHMVRGLIDGDGCFGRYSGRDQFQFVDLHLTVVKWMRNYLVDNVDIYPPKITHPSRAWRFQSGGSNVRKIHNLLYTRSTISLARKANIFKENDQTVKSVV